MKVGILTMYYKRNYGGVLQSYALYKTIESLGGDVEIIDFDYDSLINTHPLVQIKSIFSSIIRRFGLRHNRGYIQTRELPDEHIKAFYNFKGKYMRYSRLVTNKDISQVVNNYDAIVVGSDQVWNNVEGKRLFYFFDFDVVFRGVRIAYAPCSVKETVPAYNRRKVRHLLKSIDFLSVRDQTTWNLVEKVSGLKAQIVLDPSCLYDYKEFSEATPIIEEDYIFAYILGSEIKGGHNKIIEMIREKYGALKVVAAIIPNVSLEVEKFADHILYNATPADWVNLLAHARFVYTDSFHGCMFSIKYKKPFFAYYRDSKRASRLKDIKEIYSLPNVFESGDEYAINDVNYWQVDKVMKQQEIESIAFLRKGLSRSVLNESTD